MTTLANLRAQLNGEVGIATDAETEPWTITVRNSAITEGYRALWRVGVRKPLRQDIATATDDHAYALTSIRALERLELLDSSGRVISRPRGIIQDDGAGGYELYIPHTISTGATIRVHGYGAYVSTFASDAAVDDIPVEYTRIPLLKAKAILYRIALGTFAKTGETQGLPPAMAVSVENLLAIIAAAEREFDEEARVLSGLRRRAGHTGRL
jgi:hypothetical protein